MKKEYYQIKDCILTGSSSYISIYRKAWQIYLTERKKSKRRAYIRSAYFKKDKIFLDIFWSHLKEKRMTDRVRRIRLYRCALKLLKKSKNHPITVQDNDMESILHRFYGIANDGQRFVVQIKENKRNDAKYLLSVFPEK